MSQEIVFGTAHRYNWVQVAAALQHPDYGKIIDMSQIANIHCGISDSYVRLYPYNGYGDMGLLRHLMNIEKPDAIMHFTDPRQWIWLYQMEHEIRQKIPIMYYSVWDDLPYPKYNRNYYRSDDAIFAISKQTHNIHKQVLGEGNYTVI